MKILHFEDEQTWLDARRGKITGTRLKDLIIKRGNKKKIGFYELIAERVALPVSEENAMDRGKRLEEFAIERFEQDTKKKVDGSLVIWQRDDNDNIAISPDGFIGKTEAVEVKCLSSARHIEAWLTKEISSEYEEQVLQYFIVNDDLKKLYFVFYDNRCPIDFFYHTIKRKEIQEKIIEYIQLEKDVLKEIDEITKKMLF